jgi:hypothetical protein
MVALFHFPESDVNRPDDVVVGYHGTRGTTAHTILAEQRIVVKPHSYDWLGPGAYFWEEYIDRAWRWACDREAARAAREGDSYEPVGVVRGEIRLGTCVDFGELQFKQLLQEADEELVRQHAAARLDLPLNNGAFHRYDCAVVDLLCTGMDVPIDTVRAIFPEGQTLNPRTSLLTNSHLHLCVRNPAVIRKLELVDVVSWEEARRRGGIL